MALTAAAPARADEPAPSVPATPTSWPPAGWHDQSPYHLQLEADIAAIVLGGALWGGTAYFSSDIKAVCGSSTTPACNASSLNALDRLAVGRVSPGARIAADVLSALPVLYAAYDVIDVGPRHWRGWLTDLTVVAETLVWNGALQTIVSRAVHRPRPYLYTPGSYASQRDSADATFSFYSGHTAFAFAMATIAGYTFTLRHPRWWVRYLVWPLVMALASSEPILRVYSGDHFPTDVIVASVAGAAVGLLVPALHRRHPPPPGALIQGWRLVPSTTSGGAGVAVVGWF